MDVKIEKLKKEAAETHSDLNFWKEMYLNCSKSRPTLKESYKKEWQDLKKKHKSLLRKVRLLEKKKQL